MKYKYRLKRDDAKQRLVLEEEARNLEEKYMPTGKREYSSDKIAAAVKQGPHAVIHVLRSEKFYPPTDAASSLAASVIALYGAKRGEVTETEVLEDDVQALESKPVKEPKPVPADVEELPEDVFEEDALLDEDGLEEPVTRLEIEEEEEGLDDSEYMEE